MHPLLAQLVKTYLLLALDSPAVDVYSMDTSHNPVRLKSPLAAGFSHDEVTVPWVDVLAHLVLRLDTFGDDEDEVLTYRPSQKPSFILT